MTGATTVDVFQEAIMVVIRIAGPILLLCMLVGVVIAILQAVTQIHEQSIAFVMKLIVVISILALGGGWMLTTLQDFSRMLFAQMVA